MQLHYKTDQVDHVSCHAPSCIPPTSLVYLLPSYTSTLHITALCHPPTYPHQPPTHTHTTPKGPSHLQEARLLLTGGQSLQVESKQCPLQVADGRVTDVATWITAHTRHPLGEENRSRGAETFTLPAQTHNKPHHMTAPVHHICRQPNTHTQTQHSLSPPSPYLACSRWHQQRTTTDQYYWAACLPRGVEGGQCRSRAILRPYIIASTIFSHFEWCVRACIILHSLAC